MSARHSERHWMLPAMESAQDAARPAFRAALYTVLYVGPLFRAALDAANILYCMYI